VLDEDMYAMTLIVWATASSGWNSYATMDIGVDRAGGSSYTVEISDILVGMGSATSGHIPSCVYTFPYFMPSGSTVVARIASSATSVGTARIAARAYGKPAASHMFPKCTHCETLGPTAIAPGNAAWTTPWTALGSTLTYPAKWIQVNYDLSNSGVTSETTYFEVGHGDGTNNKTLLRLAHKGNTGEYRTYNWRNETFVPWRCAVNLPIGAQLYMRAYCSNSPDLNYYMSAHVFG
jgi:hypothetical protein